MDGAEMKSANTSAFDGLSYTQEDLQRVMRAHYDKIIDFVTSKAFLASMDEMSAMSHVERPSFVVDVLLNNEELTRRNIVVPDGILIQRSAFGDRRPTLFAVKHFLPKEYSDVWQNVNITFDNEFIDQQVSREKNLCWRPPLSPALQAEKMALGEGLEE
jgi:hypothetical protein